MTLVSVGQARAEIETDFPDSTLQEILEAQEAFVVGRYGDPVNRDEWTRLVRQDEIFNYERRIHTSLPISSIAAVTLDGTTLTNGSDYAQVGPYTIRLYRWPYAPNRGGWVQVTYATVDQSAAYRRVIINLTKLELTYSGYDFFRVGQIQFRSLPYDQEREHILSPLQRLSPGSVV